MRSPVLPLSLLTLTLLASGCGDKQAPAHLTAAAASAPAPASTAPAASTTVAPVVSDVDEFHSDELTPQDYAEFKNSPYNTEALPDSAADLSFNEGASLPPPPAPAPAQVAPAATAAQPAPMNGQTPALVTGGQPVAMATATGSGASTASTSSSSGGTFVRVTGLPGQGSATPSPIVVDVADRRGGFLGGFFRFLFSLFGRRSSGPKVPPIPNPQPGLTGTLPILIYNVAGLPNFISKVEPKKNMPKISPKLNTYPIALVQESFVYYKKLTRYSTHRYRSRRQRNFLRFPLRFLNDGLNRFSDVEFSDFRRVTWDECNGVTKQGSDCLARKGFSVARHTIAPGLTIDVYNLHADAADNAGDQRARAAQFRQLADFMDQYSKGRAVIVAGDTNLKPTKGPDVKVLSDFLTMTQTQEVAQFLGQPEEIDRFIWRDAPYLELKPLRLTEAKEFVDGRGQALSDHPALLAEFSWTTR